MNKTFLRIILSKNRLMPYLIKISLGLVRQHLWMIFFIIQACNSSTLPPGEYITWIRTHQALLTNSQVYGDVCTTLNYLPADWLAVKEAGSDNPEQIAAAQKEYEGLEYYRLRIATVSGQGDVLQYGIELTEDYYRRVEYFSFGFQKDLRLLVDQDTLPCKLFHFERNYGAAPYMDFMLGFEQKIGLISNRTLIYEDFVFSNNIVKLTIPAENIQKLPILTL
ncbi:MAG: hypothetical protein JNN28_06190 [Saprospiraceae bacterium]|nr:hypothetical protein [Saprospiraceae bacterium]